MTFPLANTEKVSAAHQLMDNFQFARRTHWNHILQLSRQRVQMYFVSNGNHFMHFEAKTQNNVTDFVQLISYIQQELTFGVEKATANELKTQKWL